MEADLSHVQERRCRVTAAAKGGRGQETGREARGGGRLFRGGRKRRGEHPLCPTTTPLPLTSPSLSL